MQKQLQKLLLIMVTIFAPWISQAQSLGDYTFSTDVDTTKWIDMSFATQILTPSNSDALASSVQDIGFAFPFGDEDYTQYSVNTDGNLRLGSTVTGTSNCNTPFSSTYANINNPKINFFGCDGFGVADSHYVKAINTVDATGDSMLVVEFCLGTFTTTTRNNLYKWQVHLYTNGNIEIVYGAYPATGPAVSRQIGLCINASDGWTVSHWNQGANHFTGGTPYSSVGVWEWPTQGRYYRFAMPIYSCPKPTHIAVSNLVANHFDINWTDTSAATAWIVRLTGNDTIIYDSVVSSCSVSFTGLESATRYRVQVAGLCPNGDTSLFRTTKVLTPCALLTRLPYTQNFDNEEGATTTSVPTNNLPPCWNYINHGTRNNYTGYPAVYSSATYSHSGSNSMRFYSFYTAADSAQYAIMPLTDSTLYPVNNLMLTFQMRAHNTGSTYAAVAVIGVMTNPTDVRTFVPVDTVNSNGVTTYSEYEAYFYNYTGPHGYVTMMFPYAAHVGFSYNAGYVDDMVLDVLPTCQPVQNLTALNIAPNSVDVRWTETGSASTWSVTYMPVGYSLDSAITLVTHDTTVTITGLAANTDYTVMVVANCGPRNSDTIVATFHTPCSYITSLPYVENFDGVTGSTSTTLSTNNLPTCWAYYNTGTSPSYSGYPMVYSSATYAHSGTNAMRFYTYITAGTYSDQIAVMPMTDPTTLPVSGLQVSFWTRSTSTSYNSYVVVGVMSDPTDASTFVSVDTVRTNGATTYANHTVMFGRYAGPHGHIAFKVPQPTSSYNALMIDDITVDYMPSCPHVVDLAVTYITADSVGVAWAPMGSETSWLVSDGTNTFVTTDTHYTIGGLLSGTDYTISVRPLCANADTGDAVTVAARTACGAITVLPYINNLDRYVGQTTNPASENNLPLCWGYINRGTRNNYKGYPILYNGNANSESNSIRFYSHANYADSNQYLILPPTDSLLYPINTLKVSFAMRAGNAGSTYKAEAIVGLLTNPLDPSTFVPFDTVNSNGSTAYSRYEVEYSSYNGPHGYITLLFPTPRGSSYNQNSGYVDDFVIEAIPDCPPVLNLAVSNTVGDTAVITWSDTASNASWTVEYGISGFVRGSGTVIISNDTSLMLTGLDVNTAYDVYVTPNCAGNAPGVAFLTFRTECGMIESLPYFEDFESYNIGSTSLQPPFCGIPCWHRLDNSTSNHLGYIGNYSQWPAGARSGSRFLYYYFPPTGTAYGDWVISVLPPVNTALYPVNTLKFSFWAKMDNTSAMGSIVVGVMTDPTNDSTFVPVDTVSVGGIIYDRKEIDMSTYSGTGAHIAMRLTRNTSAISYFFIDDIAIERLPVCSPVESLSLVGADTTSLILSWWETGTATSWRVEYGVSDYALDSGIAVTATSVPYTLRGLAPATSYDIRVTPICSTGTSLPRTATFRTASRRFSVPFVCDFEDTAQNRQWTLENGANHNRWHIGAATSNGGTQSLYISNDNGISNSYTVDGADALDYAYVDVTLHTPGDYGYSFDWKCEGESHYDFLRAALIPISEQLTASTSLSYGLTVATMPATWMPLDGGRKLNYQSTWQTRSDVAEVTTDGDYHLTFIFRCNNGNGSMPPPAIDNVSIAYSPCTRPDSVVLGNLTQTSVDFSWSEMNNATVWQYQLDSGVVTTIYTTHVSLTGLTPNTPHTFKVRTVCGVGDTSFWRVYDFHTPCSYLSLPYYQDFEADAVGSSTSSNFVSCWTRLNNGVSYFGYPYVNIGSHTPEGVHSLYWYNSTTYGTYGDYQCVSLPPVDTAVSVAALQLSFWIRATINTYIPKLIVGVMTDPDNISTFEAVDTVTYMGGAAWGEVTVPLSAYTGNGRFVAIKAERDTGYWSAYFDDVVLDYITTCFVPTIVYATNAAASSITLDWVDVSPAIEWQVEYGPQGYTRGSSAGTLITTTSHPVTATGLAPLSNYDFYVRPICTEGDSARWGFPTTLTSGMCDNGLIASTGSEFSTGTTYRYPVNNYYNYTLTETIIDSAELGGAMVIDFISYYYDQAPPMTDKINCTIYFQPTSRTTFSSINDVEALNPATAVRVYTGPLNCLQGWNYFPLDTVYNYDGNGNLMVIVDDNSGDYHSTSYVFKSEPCIGNKTLHYYSDSYNPDVTNPSSFAGNKYIDSSRVVMQLISCSTPICTQPVITNLTYTHESATVVWTGDGTDYEVNIKEAAATDWLAPDIHVTGNTYTFTSLLPTVDYTIRVRQDCTADSLDYSEWTIDNFVTDSMPCFAPDSFHVTAVTNTTATFDWVPVGAETAWEIHVWYSGDIDSLYTVTTHPATVGRLTAAVTYQASVRALCDSAVSVVGTWGDTIHATTAVCPDVTGLMPVAVNANSVTISWNADPLAVSWIIEYGYHGFDQGTGTTVPITLPYYTINGLTDDMQYDFRVRAVCGTNWQSEGWANVSVTTLSGGVPCEAPTNVNAVVAGNAATVSWTANTGNISFHIEYGPRGFTHGTGLMATAMSSPFTLSGLEYETDYDVYVEAVCDQGTHSAWSAVASFTTEAQGSEDCSPVTFLVANNITESSALLTWTPGATGDEWEVVLTDAAGATIVEASSTERQFALSGLTSGTAYIAKVRTVCGDSIYSDFAITYFTTSTIGIDGVAEPTCTIYPNPTCSATTVSINGVNGKVRISVVDINGREVAAETLDCSGGCAMSIDIENLAQGAYFVRITGENVSLVRKLIVR